MLKKLVRWLAVVLCTLFLLLLISGIGLYVYVQNNQHQAVREAGEQLGLNVSFSAAELTAWSTWPQIRLRLDSLTVHDTLRTGEPPTLTAENLDVYLSFNRIWEDTLNVDSFYLNNGALQLLADSTGALNLGAFAGARDSTKSGESQSSPGLFSPVIDWQGVRMGVRNFAASFIDTLKKKRFVAQLDTLESNARKSENGELLLQSVVRANVDGLAFNTDKGSYLKHSRVEARLEVIRTDSCWKIDTTLLHVNDGIYGFAASFERGGNGQKRLFFSNPEIDYDHARVLLHDELAEKLKAYHVQGPFRFSAEVFSRPDDEKNTEVRLRFATNNQAVRLQDFQFTNVTTAGLFVNRLPDGEGGTGSRRDFRIETTPTIAYYLGMRVESNKVIVRGRQGKPFIDTPVWMRGKARNLARLIGNTNFLFTDGDFELFTHVDASLLSIEDIIGSSDGRLQMTNLDLDYTPAEVRFAFGSVGLHKKGEDITFEVTSGDFPTGLDFKMDGYLNNIMPLLLERPAQQLETQVRFHADQLDWAGFRTLFGEEAYADGTPAPELSTDAQVQSMKRTLLGLQSTFHPRLEADIKQFSYYDVMSLSNFKTGLHFNGDTMVLEHTTFDWKDSKLAIDAGFDLSTFSTTPFSAKVSADHLNLNALKDPLATFGLKLPVGIDTLPEDLRIRFTHRGVINDTFGIQPGYNYGSLDFSDSHRNLFRGNVSYAPVGGELHTDFNLRGDPAFVNQLFAAEDFFFGSGRFHINVGVVGVPHDLSELVASSAMQLSIDNTRLRYLPAKAVVPIRSFSVKSENNTATVALRLDSEATRRSVALQGTLEGLTAFLYPERDESYFVKADATAKRLHLSEISEFIEFEEQPARVPILATGPTNSAPPFDPQKVLSASEGIFNSFRPDLSLHIDTFDIDRSTRFYDVHTGLRIQDSSLLVLEKTGFTTDAGRMELAGTYNLDRRFKSAFSLDWRTDSVYLDELLLTFHELGVPEDKVPGVVEGILATTGDVDGRVDEQRKVLLLNRSQAGIDLNLQRARIAEYPAAEAFGKKLLMRKRFKSIGLAPIQVALAIDSGTVNIPRTELQTTAMQAFIEGTYDTLNGPELLISVPVFPNLWRGVLEAPPEKTGFARAGWKVFLVMEPNKHGETKMRFRLGRRKFYKDRGRLTEFKAIKRAERAERKGKRKAG